MEKTKEEFVEGIVTNCKRLKQQVEFILTEFPKTRDSDALLTLRLWYYFFPNSFQEVGGKMMIDSEHVLKVFPSNDNIKRVRCIIQNTEKRLVPLSFVVAKKRGWSKEGWEEALGYHVINPKQGALI